MSLSDKLDQLAEAWPTQSSGVVWGTHILGGVTLAPQVGLLHGPMVDLMRATGGSPGVVIPACAGLIAAYLPLAWAKHRQLARLAPQIASSSRVAEIWVGPMHMSLYDMFTSTLITGSPGTGKTAGVVLPMMNEIAKTFKEENVPIDSDFQKFGALILEVKGDLTESVLYLLHEAGRCISRDVEIISPVSRIPVVRFKDEQGRFWHLCGRGGTDGNDAGRIIPPLTHPKTGYALPNDLFDRGASYIEEIEPVIRRAVIKLNGDKPNFLGWRWDGNKLVRVSHTSAFEQQEKVTRDGREIAVEPPKTLSFVEVLNVSNGIHYNFIDADVSGTEAAARLAKVIQMAQGDDGGGNKDPYWQNQMRKLISSCIMLHKEVETAECTAKDILRMVTQESVLDGKLDRLSKKIQVQQKKGEGYATREAREDFVLKHVNPLQDLAAFFNEEWKKMVADGKTANIIKSFVSGAFDAFLTDPYLAETFCNPSTIRFENCVQHGKIYAVVPGRNYQKTATIFGTAIKEGFQGVLLSRNQRSDLNPGRIVVQLIDEAQRHIVAAGTEAGDHYFMAQSRSNRVVNIYATQSYAWIYKAVGKDAGNVFLTCVGNQFWLQQTDPDTNKRASEICGSAHEEKRSAETNLNLFEVAGGKGGSVKQKVSYEEKARFKPEDFALLSTSDVIAFNKGEEGKRDKVKKGKLAFGYVTSKDGKKKAGARFREYYREFMENRLHHTGQWHMLDCDPAVATAPVPPADQKVLPPISTVGTSLPSDNGAPAPAPASPLTAPKPAGGAPNAQPPETTPSGSTPPVSNQGDNSSPEDGDVPYQSVLPLSDGEDVLAHDDPIRVEEGVRSELNDGAAPQRHPSDDASNGGRPEFAPDADPDDLPLPDAPTGQQTVPEANGKPAPRAPAVIPGENPSNTKWREREIPEEPTGGALTPAEIERQRQAYDKLHDFPGLLREHLEEAALTNHLVLELMDMAVSQDTALIPDKAVSGPGGMVHGDTAKARPRVPVPETVETDLLQTLERAQSNERDHADVHRTADHLGRTPGPVIPTADEPSVRRLRGGRQTRRAAV